MAVPPPLPAFGMSRDELRGGLRKIRKSIELKEFIGFSIWPEAQALLSRATKIGIYAPVGSEAPPKLIADWAEGNGKTLYLPWFASRSADMIFRQTCATTPLGAAPFNFIQPPESAPEAVPDVLIIPLLGFDRAGNRLGQGKGHYDRYLALHPSITRIGLAYAVQEVDVIPAEPWDMRLHGVMTEQEWIGIPQ